MEPRCLNPSEPADGYLQKNNRGHLLRSVGGNSHPRWPAGITVNQSANASGRQCLCSQDTDLVGSTGNGSDVISLLLVVAACGG